MGTYILRRLAQAVAILVLLSIAVFLVLRVAPAGPEDIICPIPCSDDRREAIREQYGLNDPYFPLSLTTGPPFVGLHAESQYGTWLKNVATGSLGEEIRGGDVSDQLKRRLPVTVELLVITFLATMLVGVPFGVVSALRRNSLADYGVRVVAVLGLAVPSFWLATLVILLPQEWWNYAPPITSTVGFFDHPWDNLRQYVPPALVLAAGSTAGVMRLTRSSLLEVLRQDYLRTARAKGLRERVVVARHALRNALIPVATVLGLQLITLFSGTVIVERIFNLPGVGAYFLQRLGMFDYQVVQTLTIYTGIVVVLVNLAVDIAYAWLDPRIRYT